MNKTEALSALASLVQEIPTLSTPQPGSEAFTRWQVRTMTALIWLLGENAPAVTRFRHIVYGHGAGSDLDVRAALWRNAMEEATILLKEVLEWNETIPPLNIQHSEKQTQ